MSIRVGLSTSSVYPLGVAAAFDIAARHGYDGVEIMVFTDPVSREAGALRNLSQLHGIPVMAVHAPTLLLTQGVWGTEPWGKIDRSCELAAQVGAEVIVIHPPFAWQKLYATGFVEGIAARTEAYGLKLCVENMFPWRTGGREIKAYLPGYDPVPHDYRHVCLDSSHAGTAGMDVVAMADALGDRLAHVHLADSLGSFRDEHLVPGRGSQPCAALLHKLVERGWSGDVVLELNTRKRTLAEREADIAESLAFAREALGRSTSRDTAN